MVPRLQANEVLLAAQMPERGYILKPWLRRAAHKESSMVNVKVAELRNRLSKYLTLVKRGEQIVIRDRNLPVAKLIPFSADESSEEELLLVASGKMRLPKAKFMMAEFLRIRTGKLAGASGIQALLDEREKSF